MLIDTHAHIYSEEFDEDRAEMLGRALQEGVDHIVMPSISREDYPRLLEVWRSYPEQTSAALGLHPAYVKEDYREQLDFMKAHLYREPWVAIGEIGLDYYWSMDFKEQQKEALREQLRWALELDLPAIFHVRNAFADVIEILREFEFVAVRGVLHSFTGTVEEMREVLSLPNLMIAINGVATFKNANLRDYITEIPLERLLVETDAPYLAPVPVRGRRNEPAFVAHTARYLSELWQINYDYFAEVTTSNARRLFAIS